MHLLITFTEPADGAEITVLSVDPSQEKREGEMEKGRHLFICLISLQGNCGYKNKTVQHWTFQNEEYFHCYINMF